MTDRIQKPVRLGFVFVGLLALLSPTCSGCASLSHGLMPAASASHDAPQRLTDNGHTVLQYLLQAAKLPDLNRPDFTSVQAEAEAFYQAAGGTLPWIHQGAPTPQALAIIQALQTADSEGLLPEDYDGPRWDARIAQLAQSRPRESALVKFDLALTISAMRYVSDLHDGRVNPRLFHYDLEVNHTNFSLADFLTQKLVNSQDVDSALASVEPPFPLYRRTREALKTYLALAQQDDGSELPVPAKPVKPGDSYAGVARLTKLLALVGDMSQEPPPADDLYRGALVSGVKHFQQRHGLDPTGRIDAATAQAMNVPLSQRAAQLALTMERLRWLPHDFERPPIIVNIPEFRLRATDDQFHWMLSMNVVVGKAYGHETPVFASQITSVIFRPYWNVPESIVHAEMLPHIRKDPNYLAENDYQVVDSSGTVVSEGPVSAQMQKQLRSGALRLRQKPGPKDALGRIKFNIPSSYDVYMHDTPARELFSRSRRDFSHGCIRVERPLELAEWVMREMPEWDAERIEESMNGDRTFEVKLPHPIPVLILYGTAVVMEDGQVHFLPDIYKQDAELEQALFAHD